MSEPVMLFMAVPIGSVIMMAADWIVGHPRCKHCGKRARIVAARDQQFAVGCPNGCPQDPMDGLK